MKWTMLNNFISFDIEVGIEIMKFLTIIEWWLRAMLEKRWTRTWSEGQEQEKKIESCFRSHWYVTDTLWVELLMKAMIFWDV